MQKAELPFDGETTAAAKFARAAATDQCNVMILIQRRLSSPFLHSSRGGGFLQHDYVHFALFEENDVAPDKRLGQKFTVKILLPML